MKQNVTDAITSHPISAGVATTVFGLPIVDLLDYASSVTTLIAGVMGIVVAYFVIQFHRTNIKLNEYKLKQMRDEE